MTKSCLRSATIVLIGTVIGAGPALAEESEAGFSHPADPIQMPAQPAPVDAFDLAVPMIDRPAAYPSYGPAPADAAADPVAQIDQMMEMDHSAHQMPGMDHSQHQMPGMDQGTPPENQL